MVINKKMYNKMSYKLYKNLNENIITILRDSVGGGDT